MDPGNLILAALVVIGAFAFARLLVFLDETRPPE